MHHDLRNEYLEDAAEGFDLATPANRTDRTPDSLKLERRGVTAPKQQAEFWSRQTGYKNAVVAKLRSRSRPDLYASLEGCHQFYTIRQCGKCGTVEKFANRCERHYCPECQPRLAWDRERATAWWANTVHGPKHVVLTVKNVSDLTSGHFAELKRWFAALRRRKFAKGWRGGLWRIEVTKEGRGWHLHIHALVDAFFIDQFRLSEEWSKISRGAARIVKVKSCRQSDYLSEVIKYTVKGSALAAWSPEEIETFIDATQHQRLFGVFGSLFNKRQQFKAYWQHYHDLAKVCRCGCGTFFFLTELEYDWKEATQGESLLSRPPPPTLQQLSLPAT